MGYTHGYTLDDKFRICTRCGKKLPNTEEVFGWAKKGVRLQAVCKECRSKIAKEKNEKLKKEKPVINRPSYDYEKECICCHRMLPYDWMHFPTDKTAKYGLRNRCRECTPNYGNFLKEDSRIYLPWTVEEIDIMKQLYSSYTGKEIHEMFLPNRTVRAIECEGEILGLEKNEIAKEKQNTIHSETAKRIFTGRIKSEEEKQRLSISKKKYYETHDSWWKGKKRSAEQCEMISQRMKGKWAGDKNPRHNNPLNGEKNGRWKGGVLTINQELRSETKDWQQESMKYCDYKCVITGGGFDNIHHTIGFNKIIDEVYNNTKLDIRPQVKDYSLDEMNMLREETKRLHNIYGFGACINKDVHKLFHDTYGYIDFKIEDFIAFVLDIKNEKYNDWFQENNLQININEKYLNYLIDISEYKQVS